MIVALFFLYWACLAASSAYAIRRGGSDERKAATIMIFGSIFTPLARRWLDSGWHSPMIGISIVDLIVMVAALALALTSRRFWPMSFASFHLVGLLTHTSLFIDRGIPALAYALVQGFWAYPMMAVMVIGTRRYEARADLNR